MISNDNCNAIINLDLDAIKFKLTHRESGEGWSPEKVNAVEGEYRRFLCLMKMFPEEPTAPVEDVDTFWHYHILDTMKYAVDCEAMFGYFLHHFPYVGMRGEEDAAALARMGDRMGELYEQTFGEKYGAALHPSPAATANDAGGAHAAYCAAGARAAYCAAGTKTAYCAIGTKAAYCAAGTKAAYCDAGTKAAYCAAGTKAAYCAAGTKAAYCAAGTKAAYCAAGTKAAYCAAGTKAAYCAAGTKAAYCATGTKAARDTSAGANAANCATIALEPESAVAQKIEFKPGFFDTRPGFASM